MVCCNFTIIPEYMYLHQFYFCSLVNYNEIFSLYFECTLSTKISHVYKKLTLHEICKVQCSHLPTNENLFQSCSFRNLDMPPIPRDNFRQQLVYHFSCKISCFCYTSHFLRAWSNSEKILLSPKAAPSFELSGKIPNRFSSLLIVSYLH